MTTPDQAQQTQEEQQAQAQQAQAQQAQAQQAQAQQAQSQQTQEEQAQAEQTQAEQTQAEQTQAEQTQAEQTQAEQTQSDNNISVQIQEQIQEQKDIEAINKKQMDMAVKFIEHNKSGLLQVYTDHSQQNEEEYGIMVVCFKEDTELNNKVEVSYVPVHLLPEGIKQQILQLKYEEKNKDIIYFMITSSEINQIIQININTLK
jgi:hypothetical protein